jgi:hypothetical protein
MFELARSQRSPPTCGLVEYKKATSAFLTKASPRSVWLVSRETKRERFWGHSACCRPSAHASWLHSPPLSPFHSATFQNGRAKTAWQCTDRAPHRPASHADALALPTAPHFDPCPLPAELRDLDAWVAPAARRANVPFFSMIWLLADCLALPQVLSSRPLRFWGPFLFIPPHYALSFDPDTIPTTITALIPN